MTEENKKPEPTFRQLAELKATTAEEYQKAMLNRVEYFSQKRDSVFNSFFENVLMFSVGTLLDFKEKVDALIGDDVKEKFQDAFQKLILTF